MDIKVDDRTVVVFDLDDTLYNEVDFLKSAYIEIATRLKPRAWKPLYASMFSRYRCKENVFEALASEFTIGIDELITMYREHIPMIQPFDGVIELLKKIRAKNGKIGIITDGRKNTQTAKIRALGIDEFVSKIVISEEIGSEKPNENNFKAVSNTYEGCHYLYIADNLKKDFVSPNQLGWRTIGLIDKGLNIHHESHLFMEANFRPQEFILDIREIRVI